MADVHVDLEREQLQQRVKSWIVDDLGYTFLGNLEDQDNSAIKVDLLKANLVKRGYKKEQIDKAVSELTDLYKNQVNSLYQVNKEIYSLLRYGKQGAKDDKGNINTVHFIDWEHIENNDFQLAEEVTTLKFDGKAHHRPDLVIYVNGIALAVFELKRSCKSIGYGIRQSLDSQKRENIQEFYHPIQLIFAGNESEGLKYGTINTSEKFYLLWKEDPKATDSLSKEIAALQSDNRLKNGIVSFCHKKRFLSFIHDFVIFDAGVKKVARYNQYFANIAARQRINEGQGGIIWNTQGSGKSLIMVWLTKWIIENVDDSRVVIITDREELDDQIESLFFDVGEKVKRAKSCADLRNILNRNDDSIICSLIHKYGNNAGKQSDIAAYAKELQNNLEPGFSAKGHIIAFIDECHRTNSGKLHEAVKVIMPDAILIGFTGTPLLSKDKKNKTSIEVFGPFIHTYKFDEGVKDGVVLDLRYEARDVNQDISNNEKVDTWFNIKTEGLTERAKTTLIQRWTSFQKLYSSKQRLEIIAADIRMDMITLPRLSTDRGTAMLVAGSIYDACRYWDIFTSSGFTKCAIITSYEPTDASVRTAATDPNKESEEEYKKRIYEKMLDGKTVSDFETEVKKKFKEEPGQMKLLIVVDKLLTGFDAPSATYIYIDKSMRDHDLFQAICRVNRPNGDDKDYGYIIDYKDLFRNVQTAMIDYTSGAFEEYDREDIDGLLKSRYDEAQAEMVGARKALEDLFDNVEGNEDTDYINYFCGENSESEEKTGLREKLYSLTSSLTRSFADCSGKLESDYGYSENQITKIRKQITGYNQVKEMIKLASCDYIDLKAYEPDMRYILDTYIKADDSKTINSLGDMTLVELLINSNQPPLLMSFLPTKVRKQKSLTITSSMKLSKRLIRIQHTTVNYLRGWKSLLNEEKLQRLAMRNT